MAREKFVDINFRAKTRLLIGQANAIIGELRAKGYTLTVRQLHYQFVQRNLYENTHNNYSRLASVVDDARKAGLIDWDAIEDRTRFLRSIANYRSPVHFLTKQIDYYAEDLFRNQDVYVECWIEKDALLGVIERPCNEYRVPYFACRGYASSSELYEAGKRLSRQQVKGKRVVVLHLGDHDPSGVNMTEVNDDSLGMFGRTHGIDVRRLALNWSQIEEYAPPPNYAKDTDSRTTGYVDTYGTDECWELDALSPEVIDEIVRSEIVGLLDMDQFKADLAEEASNRNHIRQTANEWASVRRYFEHRHTDVEGAEVITTAEDVLQKAEDEANETED